MFSFISDVINYTELAKYIFLKAASEATNKHQLTEHMQAKFMGLCYRKKKSSTQNCRAHP